MLLGQRKRPGELVSPSSRTESDEVMNGDKAQSRAKDDHFTLLSIQFHKSLELTASQVVAVLQKADKAKGLGAIWPYGRCFPVGGWPISLKPDGIRRVAFQ
jgi:hypothetical protein